MLGEIDGDYFGFSVAISAEGRLLVGAIYADNVPSVQAERHPQRTWHTQHDSVDDLAPQAMRAGIHLYAEALYRLVNATEVPFPRDVDADARAAEERGDHMTALLRRSTTDTELSATCSAA